MTKVKDDHEPELVVKEGQPPYYLSDDGYGTKIAWDTCHRYSGGCGQMLMSCNCTGGPKEPYYITRWRIEAKGGVFERVKTAVTTSVRSALGKEPVGRSAPKPKSMSDFIDADVIAKVKAAKEAQGDQDDQ